MPPMPANSPAIFTSSSYGDVPARTVTGFADKLESPSRAGHGKAGWLGASLGSELGRGDDRAVLVQHPVARWADQRQVVHGRDALADLVKRDDVVNVYDALDAVGLG